MELEERIYVSKIPWRDPEIPGKNGCYFWGPVFGWQKDWSVTKLRNAATFRRLVRGPKLASRSGIRRWGERSGRPCGFLVPVLCVLYWLLVVVIIGCFFLLCCYPFLFCKCMDFVDFWPESFPQIVGSLCYQPKLHAFFFRGSPSNLPYIRCVSFPP